MAEKIVKFVILVVISTFMEQLQKIEDLQKVMKAAKMHFVVFERPMTFSNLLQIIF